MRWSQDDAKVSKTRWPGNPASTSPGREVSDNSNPCVLESVTMLFACPQSCNWPGSGEGRHRNDDLISWFATSGEVFHREDIGVLQERISSSSYKVQRNPIYIQK